MGLPIAQQILSEKRALILFYDDLVVVVLLFGVLAVCLFTSKGLLSTLLFGGLLVYVPALIFGVSIILRLFQSRYDVTRYVIYQNCIAIEGRLTKRLIEKVSISRVNVTQNILERKLKLVRLQIYLKGHLLNERRITLIGLKPETADAVLRFVAS